MKSKRQPFDEGGSFVARKTFRFHGRTFARGAEFPWKRLSCSARKLFQLYDNGFLVLASELEPQAEPAPDNSPEAKTERRKEAGRKAAEARKRNAEAKAAAAAAPAEPEAAGE
jgi:hypothetical protein